jgi:hypothetical protein
MTDFFSTRPGSSLANLRALHSRRNIGTASTPNGLLLVERATSSQSFNPLASSRANVGGKTPCSFRGRTSKDQARKNSDLFTKRIKQNFLDTPRGLSPGKLFD